MSLSYYVFETYFLKIIFKLKNKKYFLKTNFRKHEQMNPKYYIYI